MMPLARNSDPVTSHFAAAEAGGFAKHHRATIVGALRGAGRALAAEEIADAAGFDTHVSVNRRLSELENAGAIVKTDQLHINRSGRKAYRYIISEAA